MFIYVMDEKSKALLEKHGYKLIKGNDSLGVWCFENKHDCEFEIKCPCVISDILTF